MTELIGIVTGIESGKQYFDKVCRVTIRIKNPENELRGAIVISSNELTLDDEVAITIAKVAAVAGEPASRPPEEVPNV